MSLDALKNTSCNPLTGIRISIVELAIYLNDEKKNYIKYYLINNTGR